MQQLDFIIQAGSTNKELINRARWRQVCAVIKVSKFRIIVIKLTENRIESLSSSAWCRRKEVLGRLLKKLYVTGIRQTFTIYFIFSPDMFRILGRNEGCDQHRKGEIWLMGNLPVGTDYCNSTRRPSHLFTLTSSLTWFVSCLSCRQEYRLLRVVHSFTIVLKSRT